MESQITRVKLLPKRAHNSPFLVKKVNKLIKKKPSSKIGRFFKRKKTLVFKKISKFKNSSIFLSRPLIFPDFKKILNQEVSRADILVLLNVTIIAWMATIGTAPLAKSEEHVDSLAGAAYDDLTNFNSLAMAAGSKIVSPGCDDPTRCDFDGYKYLEKKCDIDKDRRRNSEVCGRDYPDEELEKELQKMDQAKARAAAGRLAAGRKISAPKPLAEVKRDALGRRVCAKSNDRPGKSDQNKGKHMDMECCLDPDEYPNPHCYYPPGKYGKYLR